MSYLHTPLYLCYTCTLLGNHSPGDTCTFTCDDGFEISGTQSRTCQDGGTWNGVDDTLCTGTVSYTTCRFQNS